MRILPTLALLFIASPLLAWTDPVERRIARKSIQLSPPDLRTLIERFEADYEEGRRAARETESHSRNHFYSVDRDSELRQQIERAVGRAIVTMRNRRSTGDFVATLGQIAHLIADANHPLHARGSDPRLMAIKPDLDAYLQSRAEVIPTIFYGLKEPFSLSPFLETTFRRSASYHPLLTEQYFPKGGRPRTSADFDDRSTPFGVVSLSYSHAVTDLVNVHYYIWKEVGGDVRSAAAMRRGTIFLNASPQAERLTPEPSKSEPLRGGFGAPAGRE